MTPVELVKLAAKAIENGWTPNNLKRAANHATKATHPNYNLEQELQRMADTPNIVRPEHRSPAAPLPPPPTGQQRSHAAHKLAEARARLNQPPKDQ